jgi:hypothetical protein
MNDEPKYEPYEVRCSRLQQALAETEKERERLKGEIEALKAEVRCLRSICQNKDRQ